MQWPPVAARPQQALQQRNLRGVRVPGRGSRAYVMNIVSDVMSGAGWTGGESGGWGIVNYSRDPSWRGGHSYFLGRLPVTSCAFPLCVLPAAHLFWRGITHRSPGDNAVSSRTIWVHKTRIWLNWRECLSLNPSARRSMILLWIACARQTSKVFWEVFVQ